MTRKSKRSGKTQRLNGHKYEAKVSEYLSDNSCQTFHIEGDNWTKVDVASEDGSIKLSIKNPSGRNTQVSLVSQKRFIESMKISDSNVISFIGEFFGGNSLSKHRRHRLTLKTIDESKSKSFMSFLTNNTRELLSKILVCGFNDGDRATHLWWANNKDSLNNISLIGFDNIIDECLKSGTWVESPRSTTYAFMVDGKKLLHLQMKGSGKKYTSGYHALQFHLHSTAFEKFACKTVDMLME